MIATQDTQYWLDKAASLEPLIAKHSDESESARRMAQPIFHALQASGIFEMLAPKSLGGPQADYEAYLRVVEELARQDGSTGWNTMIWAAQGLFADYLPKSVAERLLGAGAGNLICGAVNPTGRAVVVDGGLKVAGRWSFASGCQYATWLIGGCMVIDGEAPHFLAEGIPDVRLVLIPSSACSIVDTWTTTGLRGTGSHDFQVEGVFVPDDYVIPLGLFFMGPPAEAAAVHRTPFYDLAAPQIAVVGLGIARKAVEAFKAMAAGKTPAIGTVPLAGLHTVHQRVGRAEALIRSVRAYLYETLREVTSAHQAGAVVQDEDSASLRLASAHAAQCAVEAVDLLFDAAGGSSIYAGNALERCFRDVHMVNHHMMASPANIEMVGQYLLGGPLQVRR